MTVFWKELRIVIIKSLMEEGKFILTIFEKRVDPQDLPFFMNLQKHLSENGFHCPVPIENKDKKTINSLCVIKKQS